MVSFLKHLNDALTNSERKISTERSTTMAEHLLITICSSSASCEMFRAEDDNVASSPQGTFNNEGIADRMRAALPGLISLTVATYPKGAQHIQRAAVNTIKALCKGKLTPTRPLH